MPTLFLNGLRARALRPGVGLVEYILDVAAVLLDLSRFRAAPIAHLCSLCFEGQGAFPAEC